MNKFVSKNGYIIHDIYGEIQNSIIQRNCEKSCYLSAELLCSGQIKKFLNWLVYKIGHDYITLNAYIVQFIGQRLELIESIGFKWQNKDIQKAICEMMILLCMERQNQVIVYKPDMDGGKYVEALYFQRPKNFPELNDGMGLIVNNDKYIIFVYMYEFMVQGDIKSVFKIMSHIIRKCATIEECETLPLVNNIKKFKNDSVWALWQVLFIYIKRPQNTNSYLKLYLENAFKVFAFDFTRKNKTERLNVLYVCYMICVRNKSIVYSELNNDLIKKASSQIDILYNDVLNKKVVDKAKQPPSQKKNNKKASVSNVISNKSEINDKMKYLFVCTYRNETLPMYKDRNLYSKTDIISEIKNLNIDNDETEIINNMQPNLFVEKL